MKFFWMDTHQAIEVVLSLEIVCYLGNIQDYSEQIAHPDTEYEKKRSLLNNHLYYKLTV